MSKPDYSPEFVDTLNAWEQNPPLTAEFVFDLPPGDARKADKVGVLMYQAVLIKQEHPALDFARLRAVTFTMDVHRTGDELERIVGHDLPHYRSAAARLDAFHVNLGPGQVLVITDELAQASLSPQLATRLAAWELLRTELVRSVAVARLAAAPPSASPGSAPRWQTFARYVWTEWFCGFHAAVEGMQTPMARNRLRDALEQDPANLTQATQQFALDHDMAEFVTRAEGCARGLFEAMAEVLGQLAAGRQGLDSVDPHLETLIHAHGLPWLWEALGVTLVAHADGPGTADPAAAWQALIGLAQRWLVPAGLRYGGDNELSAAPLPGNSAGETP
jgi:hypothetical protein